MWLLKVRGLARRPLFEDRDLDLVRGEIVVLSGPSGSGKTLFLRGLADLDPVDAGTVDLEGTSREAIAPEVWRSRVLYVHQAGVRLPGTVEENVACVAGLAIGKKGRPRVAEPVPGLDPQADAELLSGGEAQALALQRAMLCRPDVLLLDEATSAMDPATQAAWEARVGAYAAAGAGVLWVAHDTLLAGRVGARQERLA